MLSTCLGAIPCTSYTQNVGIIAATGVASRFVVRIAAVILVLYGLCPKLGALLVAMPRAVLGGVFVLVCGMIASSGMRLLAAAQPTTANSFVIGATLVTSVAVPVYVRYVLGNEWLDQLPAISRLLLPTRSSLRSCSALASTCCSTSFWAAKKKAEKNLQLTWFDSSGFLALAGRSD